MTKFEDNYPPGYDGKADGFVPEVKKFVGFHDPIGYFRGVGIIKMTREQLLDFAKWAFLQLEQFEIYKEKHHELDLHEEASIKMREQENKARWRQTLLRRMMGLKF